MLANAHQCNAPMQTAGAGPHARSAGGTHLPHIAHIMAPLITPCALLSILVWPVCTPASHTLVLKQACRQRTGCKHKLWVPE